MEILLGKVTQQAMNYAIRSGITMTAGFAIKQTTRLLRTAEGDERDELQDLQLRLESKIKIISPAIDMIELISARGNTSLESAVTLTKSLRHGIQLLGQRLAKAAEVEEDMQRRSSNPKDKARHSFELKQIAANIRKLLTRIEDAVPLINLAIAASGANLSSSLPSTVSPSRLLQASTFLTAGDSQYGTSVQSAVQIGPNFTLSLYMLFQGHLRPETEEEVRETTWKEVIHKADVRLMRVPIPSLYELPVIGKEGTTADFRPDEFAYQMIIVEDLEDDRVHTFEDDEQQPEAYGDIAVAGIREVLPIHEISKIFYADTGKILNIGTDGETNNPVLLLKRDVNGIPPRRMTDSLESHHEVDSTTNEAQAWSPGIDGIDIAGSEVSAARKGNIPKVWQLPQGLDTEWLAFEVYSEAEDSETETEMEAFSPQRDSHSVSSEPMTNEMSRLSMNGTSQSPSASLPTTPSKQPQSLQPSLPPIRTSLSLLEMLLRLLSLQQFQQSPHLSIPDELLTFFLSEAASTGAASSDGQERRRLREEARRHVGFDPYDESPIKRHGEEYQYRSQQAEWDDRRNSSAMGYSSPSRYEDEGYGTSDWPPMPRRRQSGSPRSMPRTPSVTDPSKRTTPLSSPGVRPPPVGRWSHRIRDSSERKGSPLSRPATGLTDEGIGTSPTSVNGDAKSG